jgi:hypothetical protein
MKIISSSADPRSWNMQNLGEPWPQWHICEIAPQIERAGC